MTESISKIEIQTKTRDHQENLAVFLEQIDSDKSKLTNQERQQFAQKLQEWNEQTGENADKAVEQIRIAGVSSTANENNYLRRHILLSSEFLKRDSATNNFRFTVDFKGNQLAEWRVGAADMLPPNVKKIRVGGTIGERKRNPATGRIGYYDENNNYLAVHSGDQIDILETYKVQQDPKLDINIFQEHIEIYQHGAAKEEHSEPYEKAYNPETREVTASIKNAKLHEIKKKYLEKRNQIRQKISEGATLSDQQVRQKISNAAKARATQTAKGIVDPNFRSSDVNGGKLACAKVVNTILKEAGMINGKPKLSVAGTIKDLKKRGWTESNEKAKSGDIVVWDRISGYVKNQHIGIATTPDLAVNNKNSAKGPVESSIYDYRIGGRLRPVIMILKPPVVKTNSNPDLKPSTVSGHKRETVEVTSEGNDTTRGLSGEALIKNQQFRNRLKQVATNIGCMPEDLIAIFQLESGISPQTQNRHGATGLIQWMPKTAKHMYKLEVNQIRKMSGLKQLDLVEIYFKKQGRNNNIDDLYLSVLYPYAKNQPDNYIMGSQGGMHRAQNFAKHNPFNGKENGKARLVTKADVLKKIRNIRTKSPFVRLYQRLENRT